MAYLAQPVIVGSPSGPNVVVIGDALTSTMDLRLAGNIVRSSHYIPDSSSSPLSTDPHSLHPTLKSLPYPLTLPSVSPLNNNHGNNSYINTANSNFPRATTFTAFNGTNGASFEEFEDDEEDADTEDSRSLMSAVTVESITDNNSGFPGTSYTSYQSIPVGSSRENSMPARGGPAANVRSPSLSRSPVVYHHIPVGHMGGPISYPIIPTVPNAAVAVAVPIVQARSVASPMGIGLGTGASGTQYSGVPPAGAIQNNGSPVDRVPGSRVVDASTKRGDASVRGYSTRAGVTRGAEGGAASEE